MFGIGSTELLVILLVALIVLGPRSLAGFSSKLGKLVGEFRRISTDFQRTLNLEAAREEVREAEQKRAQARAAEKAEGKEQEEKGEALSGTPTAEDLRLHGIPEDSPLAKALQRTREQAEKGSVRLDKKEDTQVRASLKSEDKDAAKQEEDDKRA